MSRSDCEEKPFASNNIVVSPLVFLCSNELCTKGASCISELCLFDNNPSFCQNSRIFIKRARELVGWIGRSAKGEFVHVVCDVLENGNILKIDEKHSDPDAQIHIGEKCVWQANGGGGKVTHISQENILFDDPSLL